MGRGGRGRSPSPSRAAPMRTSAPARAPPMPRAPMRRPAPEMKRMAPPPRPAQTTPQPAATSNVPAAAPASQVGAPAASQGPGLMGQMAATAGGVAIGSVVGHGLTSAIFGSGSSSSNNNDAAQQQAPPPPQPYYDQGPAPPQAYNAGYNTPGQYGNDYSQQYPQGGAQSNNVCGAELEQFLRCAESSADITFCQGLNEALKQCKMSYGQQHQGGEWLSS